MEKRKNDHADLEKRRGLFFVFGIALALSSTLMAIQHTTVETDRLTASLSPFEDLDVIVEPALVSIPKKPEAPKLRPQQIIDKIEIVKDPIEDPSEEPQKLPDIDLDVDFSEFGGDGDDFDDTPTFEDKEWIRVEIMPHFESCIDVLNRDQQEQCTNLEIIKIVAKNAHYPSHLRDAGIQGTVYVSFVIDRKGEVTDVKVQRGVHKGLDKEAVKAVKSLPTFIPGEQQGKKQRVVYNLPVTFKIK